MGAKGDNRNDRRYMVNFSLNARQHTYLYIHLDIFSVRGCCALPGGKPQPSTYGSNSSHAQKGHDGFVHFTKSFQPQT